MISELRSRFNAGFTPGKYHEFLRRMDQLCGTPIQFRQCETPCFFPKPLLDRMVAYGQQLIRQLVEDAGYREASRRSIPREFDTPGESPHPLFVQVDFGLARDAKGNLEPKLVEIQGFPSLYAFQPVMAQSYREVYGLDDDLRFLLGELELDAYNRLLRRAILGDRDPENVVLLEIAPEQQKTLPDFLLTERLCGIRTVCITSVVKQGPRLFYRRNGRLLPIHRIYNRAIADELVRRATRLPFRFTDDLDVEWAGHPNWFFRISKFSIPHLRHACVPKSWFLDRLERPPDDLQNYVLKPLYSFAGLGVVVGPDREELARILPQQRANYILQERIDFAPVIETLPGPTKAELRIMYLWVERLTAVTTIVRMGRGKMMGVDHNRDMEWVGAAAAFYPGSALQSPRQ